MKSIIMIAVVGSIVLLVDYLIFQRNIPTVLSDASGKKKDSYNSKPKTSQSRLKKAGLLIKGAVGSIGRAIKSWVF